MRFRRTAVLLLLAALAALLLMAPSPARADLREDLAKQRMSVMAGPSPWGWNIVGVKKDIVREPQTTLFVTAGLGEILVGGGAAYHPLGRNADGPILSAVLGIWGVHAGASYQWKINPVDFIHLGVHVGSGYVWDEHVLPIVAWEHRL
jgi:hypothetical protein